MTEIIIDIETIPNQELYNIQNNEINKKLLDIRDIINRKLEHKKDNDIIKYSSINWEFNQILCIGYKINNGESNCILYDNEDRLLIDFWDILDELHFRNQDIKIITFNGKRFDIPIIMLHSAILNQTSFKLSNKRYDTFKHYDILEVLTNFYQNQNFLTLQEYCKIFNIENKDNSKGSNVYELFKDSKFNEIKQHCIEDVEATRKLYDRIKNYL